MLQHGISSLAANPVTRRELLLIISMTVLFTLIVQFDFAQTSPDGTRTILGHAPWSIGAPGSVAGGQTGSTGKSSRISPDGAWADDPENMRKITGEESFLGHLTGMNALGSHGNVGRWREMTMNDSMVTWGDGDAPRTEIVAHAPGRCLSIH
jgi:hypothetical protein